MNTTKCKGKPERITLEAAIKDRFNLIKKYNPNAEMQLFVLNSYDKNEYTKIICKEIEKFNKEYSVSNTLLDDFGLGIKGFAIYISIELCIDEIFELNDPESFEPWEMSCIDDKAFQVSIGIMHFVHNSNKYIDVDRYFNALWCDPTKQQPIFYKRPGYRDGKLEEIVYNKI